MKRFLLATTLLVGFAGAAAAQSIADQVIAGLQDQGFTSFEVEQDDGTVKVEGVRPDGTKVELVYDATTGDLLSQETYAPGTYDESDDDMDDDSDDSCDDDSDDDSDEGEDDSCDDDGEDHDRGHGNDEDGWDDDNPGRGHENGRGQGRGRGGDRDDDEDEGYDD